jgi:hypothetical protein
MREDALEWVKEQEELRERRQRISFVATIAAAGGAWLAGEGCCVARVSVASHDYRLEQRARLRFHFDGRGVSRREPWAR